MSTEESSVNKELGSHEKVLSEIYADLASPSMRRAGGALETIFKVGLSPISLLDFGYEQSKEWLLRKIDERRRDIPKECLRTPKNNISVPAIIAISMNSDCPELRDLYAELLLKAIDTRTESLVHPSYIGIIGQLTPEEALLLISLEADPFGLLFSENDPLYFRESIEIEKQFYNHCNSIGLNSNCNYQLWLENFQRLRLLKLSEYSDATYQEDFEDRRPEVMNITTRHLSITDYGLGFIKACTPPKAVK